MCPLALLAFAAVVAPAAHAAVTIDGFTYDHVDPGPDFTEAPRAVQDWQPPTPSPAEAAAGAVAYVTSDPGDVKPYRIPKPAQHADRLSVSVARGEQEPMWFDLFGLRDLTGLSARVDLKGAPVEAEVRNLFMWPQRTGWGSRQWYWTPELLVPCRDGQVQAPTHDGLLEWKPLNLKQGESGGFYVTLTAPPDAKPGVYEATVTVSSVGRPDLVLALRIQVYPFVLTRPRDRWWLMYADAFRWNGMSEEQIRLDLRDFARHGMTGLVELPLGSPDLSHLKEGKVSFDASAYLRLAKLARECGLPGPHVVNCGVEEAVRDALGLHVDLNKDPWPQALKDGIALVAKAAVEATKDEPAQWYWYGWDEPAGDNTFAVQQYQAWHQGGAKTYATFGDPGFLAQAASYLKAPCFVSYLISTAKGAEAARGNCQKTGAEFWWYGTGSYVNPFPQEGFLFHNRYGAGLLNWKAGAKACVSWTFCRAHEDVFNDFDGSLQNAAEPKDQVTAYPQFLKPGDASTYQGAIPTLAWEGLREGVDDYSYLRMLADRIAEARRSDRAGVREAADQAQATLNALTDAIPWTNPMVAQPFETKRLLQVRAAVAAQIIHLETTTGKLGQAPPAGAGRAAPRVALRLTTAAPSQPALVSLPVLALPKTAVPPTIDGALNDACWTHGSAGISHFLYAGSGKPAEAVATRASVCYDDTALYVAFACQEPHMDKLVARQSGHHQSMVWVDDGVEVFVDPTGQRRKYAHFILNTNGSLYDELGQDPSWDSNIAYGVRKRADGYDVELAIPWATLASAGLPRSPLMALNLCRNRFAGAQPEPHMAWACPFGGYHAPDRFGVAALAEGPLAITGIDVPQLWGRQEAAVRLRNLGDRPVAATVRLNARRRTLTLAPGAAGVVVIPVNLTRPGRHNLRLAWGLAGEAPTTATFAVITPAPLEMPGEGWLVGPGEVAEGTVRLNVAPTSAQNLRVRLRSTSGDNTQTTYLPAQPGQAAEQALILDGASASVEVALVGPDGKPACEAVKATLVALP